MPPVSVFFKSRNIGLVTLESIIILYKNLDPSIQNVFDLILKKEVLITGECFFLKCR